MRLGWLSALALAAGLAGAAAAVAAPAADLVISGGPILTMAGDVPETVEAVAVRGGRIIATGVRADIDRLAGKATRRVDLHGRTLLPGFIDAHGHISMLGQVAGLAQLSPPPVGGVQSIAALQDALRAYIRDRALPAGGLAMGFGYDDARISERRHPTRADLDAVATDRPILVTHTSGHLASMNSAALAYFGISADTPDPSGGVIRREADGQTPNGVIEETALIGVIRKITPAGPDAGIAALVSAQHIYAANGITTAQDGRVMPESWLVLAEAARRGKLSMDVVALVSFEPDWPEAVRALIGKPYAGRLRIGGIKLTIDGSPQGRTAWLHDPVPVPPPGRGADYRGFPAIEMKMLHSRMRDAAQHDWQVFVHVNGDQAMQALLDAVRDDGLSGRRTIAIHSQVVRPEQLLVMKTLDVQPSFFASHTWYWGDWHRDVALGPKRADFISPQASAWAAGLVPTAHNDSPVVPPDMLRLIWSSVNRQTRSGDILGPTERIDVYRALQQVTANAAWQIREEADKGSITPGKRADFVVLDRNPMTSDPATLADIDVVATLKDGQPIFGTLDAPAEARQTAH